MAGGLSNKAPVSPVWWKNTFFLFGFLLLALAVFGLVRGESAIRDPGQKFESGLVVFYFVGGIAMLVNGWITHVQARQVFEEYSGLNGPKDSSKDPEPQSDGGESNDG